MAVFTSLTRDELTPWLTAYDLGDAVELTGIASGIENSNFFLTTEKRGGPDGASAATRSDYVLTIFEKLSAAELPFYLNLTAHLSTAGVPCPGPVATRNGNNFLELKGKPAAIVRRLPGKSHMRPGDTERAQVASMLACMHRAGQSFSGVQANPRGPHWWAVTAPKVMPYLGIAESALLQDELQHQLAHRNDALPRGPVHADLFRDNVLFDTSSGTIRLGGFIDFYFAGCDCLLFDVAVCVNDWCIEHDGAVTGTLIGHDAQVFLNAYHQMRPFTAAEHAAWPLMLRAAALRFWLSRLYDFHLPRPGELITPHDPAHFERILTMRRAAPSLPWIG